MPLKKVQITYGLFLLASMAVILCALFLEKELLIYVKPFVSVSLIFMYLTSAKEKSIWYPISILFVSITDALVYMDFLEYFNYIAVSTTIFYIICCYLLKDYIKVSDIKINRLTILPVTISAVLISYVVFSIASLVWDKIADSAFFFGMILIGVLLLAIMCFFIFMADRYKDTINVFIAGCCCLIVDILLGINELSFYSRVFTIIINLTEIAGLYYFLRFLLDARPTQAIPKEERYF